MCVLPGHPLCQRPWADLGWNPKVHSLFPMGSDLWNGLVWAALPWARFMCHSGDYASGCRSSGGYCLSMEMSESDSRWGPALRTRGTAEPRTGRTWEHPVLHSTGKKTEAQGCQGICPHFFPLIDSFIYSTMMPSVSHVSGIGLGAGVIRNWVSHREQKFVNLKERHNWEWRVSGRKREGEERAALAL